MVRKINYQTVIVSSINQKIKRNGVVTKNYGSGVTIRCTKAKDFKIGESIIIRGVGSDVGEMTYGGILGGIIENSLIIKELKVIASKQDRKKVRVVVNLPLEVEEIKNETEVLISLNKPIYMVSKNISTEGILLESNLDIPKEVHFLVEVPLPKGTVKIETVTIRKYKKDGLYYYGCIFSVIDEEDTNILENFIVKNHNEKFFRYYRVNY